VAEDLTPPEPNALPGPGTSLEPVEPSESVEVEVMEADRTPVRHVAQAAEAHRHRRRFSLAYFLLAAVAGAVIVTLIALVANRPHAKPPWSAFQPQGDRVTKATEIAAFVAPQYHLDDGQQIVLARASQPVVQGNIPIELIAIVKVAADGVAEGGYDMLDASHAFAYQLCGLGDKCAIKSGTPSADRERLLRREGLELALYTFKYVPNTDTVVVYMPPPAGKDPTIALLFRKSQYAPELSHPLAQTLPDPVPTPTALADEPQKNVVEELTANRRYGFSFTQLQDGNVALVLDSTKLSA
jgi:hypothetical protein